jgi:glycosyltransferase involved in cell wall biosynthesis
MIRVTHLTDSVSRRAGGMFESVRGLCSALNASGRIRAVACAGEDEFTATDIKVWQGVPLQIAPPKAGFVGKAVGIYRTIEATPAELFHLQGIWSSSSLALAARQIAESRTPYIVSPRGMLEPWALQLSRLKKNLAWRLWQGRLLKQAACIHALCEAEASSIQKLNLGRPICIVPNGVTLPDALPERTASSKTLLFLGRIHPKKGLAELLNAFSRIEQKNGWRLAIAGWDDGGHLDDLRALAGQLGLQRDVEFTGPVFGDRKNELFRQSAAFILPSHSEGLPMAVLEAWSYKLPALISTECHLDIGFRTGAAIRADPNVASIESGLRELFAKSPAELQAMGGKGHSLAAERFTWQKIAEQFAGVYEWMLGGAKPDYVV